MSEQQLLDYYRIENAIEFIASHQPDQPSLEEIAASVNLSPHHLRRLFTRWAGISPKKFLQYLTLERSRERLSSGSSLADVAFYSGLSGTGRLHDLYIRFEGMTPGQYRDSGKDIVIYYEFFPSVFGNFLLGVTDGGSICYLSFIQNPEEAVSDLRSRWKSACITRDAEHTAPIADQVLSPEPGSEISLLALGTEFRLKVWEALLKIPFGAIVSYQTIAQLAGNPKALQAVGGAIGSNPVAYLIPCHRVIRKAGNINQYRWGKSRKIAMIGWEACVSETLNPKK